MPVRTMLLLLGLLISGSAMASRIDSVGVENLEGKQVILHKLDPKESYFSLGRKYNVNPAAIIDYNRNKALKIGDLVKIPTQRPFVASSTAPAAFVQESVQQEDLISYKVKPKETLFSIAKKFNTSIDDIRKINNLRSSALSVGQSLKIRNTSTGVYAEATPAAAVPAPVNEIPAAPLGTPAESTVEPTDVANTNTDRRLPAARYGLKEIKEKGIASWMEDEGMDESKMLALHPTAPIGTIIKITNPMTQKSTFAKVVGKFAENESNKGLVIIITKTAAELIGALDKRFQVNLVYGIPDEQ